MMLLGGFSFALISMFFGVVAALPWITLYEGLKERSSGTIMSGATFCVLEICFVADWAMGYA